MSEPTVSTARSWTGGCRCGAVRLTFRSALAAIPIRACGCSFCRRYDARAVTDPAGSVRIVLHDPDAVVRHRFGLGTADFLVCRRCDAYVAAVMHDGARAYATVNAATFDRPLEGPAEAVSYEGESADERRARRRARWTPTETIEIHDGRSRVDVVRVLFEEYASSLGFDLGFQGFDAELAGLPGAYAPPSGRLHVARIRDADAGCVALRPLPDGACEMKRLYVRPAFRGVGLGRVLAVRVIDDARAIGYREMRLDTIDTMAEALSLYRSLGFTDTVPYCHNPMPDARFLALRL
jgi:hypothetical protein